MIENSDPPGLNISNLKHWLSINIDGFSVDTALQTKLLAGGRSNISYQITAESGTSVVLRRPPLGNVMPSAHDMQREFRVLAGLNNTTFPVPRALGLCEDYSVIGAGFMVMSFVDGRVIAEAKDAERLTAQQADEISHSLISTLATLHQLNPKEAHLEDLGRPEGYLDRQVKRWAQQWEITKTRDVETVTHLHRWLSSQCSFLPAHRPTSLVHGDYRIDNVILDTTTSDIRAVLDWEMATLGDPISDLAISLVYWTRHTDTLRAQVPVAQHITDGPGFWSREQFVSQYCNLTGFAADHLDFCVALACFKLAVIMESIHKRNLDGQQLGAASGSDSTMGQATLALAELGTATIEQGALKALNS